MQKKYFYVLCLCILCNISGFSESEYKLRDYVGQNWKNEKVEFSITEEDIVNAKHRRLIDSTNKEVLYQIDKQGKKLYFLADLKPFTENTYQFNDKKIEKLSDIAVDNQDEYIEIKNSKTGIRIYKKLAEGCAPVKSWMLNSGTWVGKSLLDVKSQIKHYSAELTAEGPVFASIKVRVEFENGGVWDSQFELQAFEPVVVVKEKFDCPVNTGQYSLVLNEHFNMDQVLYRLGITRNGFQGKKQVLNGELVIEAIPGNNEKEYVLFNMEPWLHTNFNPPRVNSFSLYNKNSDDLFCMGTLHAGIWVDPDIDKEKRANVLIPVVKDAEGCLALHFELKKGQREFFLGTFSKFATFADIYRGDLTRIPGYNKDIFDDMEKELGEKKGDLFDDTGITKKTKDKLKELQKSILFENVLSNLDEREGFYAPLPQQYQVKHGTLSLDKIRRFVYEWQKNERNHPCMFLTQNQLESFLENYKIDQKLLKKLQNPKNGITTYKLDDIIPLYLATKDEVIEEKLISMAEQLVQNTINRLFRQTDLLYLGYAPHHHTGSIMPAVNILDAVYDSPRFDQNRKQRFLAQLAFLGYILSSPEYFSLKRDYCRILYNLNGVVGDNLASVATAIPNHPESKEWCDYSMTILKDYLFDNWFDKDGGWNGTRIEAPHYAMCSYDALLGTFIKMHNTGMNDFLFDPKMKTVIEWFARISTPNDCRLYNWRHLPPIGNTYKFEPCGEFGVVATVWKKKDPKFASEMQWMYNQQGYQNSPGQGGFSAMIAGYRKMLISKDIKPEMPGYKSYWYPSSGVVLRNNYGKKNEESYLYMISGCAWSHYDNDSGAVTIWGKGQIISDDFGYTGMAPSQWQSRLTAASAPGRIYTREFKTGTFLDFAHAGNKNWERQVMLVKNSDSPGLSDYFLINDSLRNPGEATWRLWLSPEPVKLHGSSGVLLTGDKKELGPKDDIEALLDLDDESGSEALDDIPKCVYIGKKSALMKGYNNIDTEVVFATLPGQSKLIAKAGTIMAKAGIFNDKYASQIELRIQSPKFDSLLTVIYPYDNKEKVPVIKSIADGKGFEIKFKNYTDYIFLSTDEFKYKKEKLSFDGTIGFARVNKNDIKLYLPVSGEISYANKKLNHE